MKRYRLAGWPELPAAYHRTAYQRMLHRMSHRPASLRQLVRESGLQTSAVRGFLDSLSQQDLLIEDDLAIQPTLIGWIKLRFTPAAPR
jgi:lambda repressor-like predicted transcriptional regulator